MNQEEWALVITAGRTLVDLLIEGVDTFEEYQTAYQLSLSLREKAYAQGYAVAEEPSPGPSYVYPFPSFPVQDSYKRPWCMPCAAHAFIGLDSGCIALDENIKSFIANVRQNCISSKNFGGLLKELPFDHLPCKCYKCGKNMLRE